MRHFLTILFLFLSSVVFGAAGDTIWVCGVDGSDAYTTQTKAQAIKTLPKLQTIIDTMTVGKVIALSDTSYYVTATLTFLNKTGTAVKTYKLVTWNKFGNGRAKIKGMKQLTGWTNEGSNIWSKVDAALPNYETYDIGAIYDWNLILNGLWIDGDWKSIAQTPNTGYYDLSSWAPNGKDYIVDNHALFTSGEYNGYGAYIYLGAAEWFADKAQITSNTTTTLYLDATEVYNDLNNYWGSFVALKFKVINNVPNVFGEWNYSYSAQRVRMYSTVNPSAYMIYAPVCDMLVNIDNSDYVTIDGIEFWGANVYQVYIENGSDEISITNTKHFYSGHTAIMYDRSYDISITNDTIKYGNLNGIFGVGNYDGSNLVINSCTVTNMGENQYYADGEQGYIGIGGVYNECDQDLKYNHTDYTGYNGLSFSTSTGAEYVDGTVITFGNLVNHWCMHLSDGGGIYFGNYNDNTSKIIRNNIILNQGTDGSFNWNGYQTNCMGIYLDGVEASQYFQIDSNTVYNAQMAIYLQHTANHNTVRYNTTVGYTPDVQSSLYSAGFYKVEQGSDYLLYDHNLNVATDSLSECFMWRYNAPHSSTGTYVDYNTHFNLFRYDNKVVATYEQLAPTFTYRTVASQYSTLGYEQHSTGNQNDYYYYEVDCEPEDFVWLFTNWSGTTHIFDLGNVIFKDISGNNISTSLDVESYESQVIFYVSGNVATVENPFYEGITVEEGQQQGVKGLHVAVFGTKNKLAKISGKGYYIGSGTIPQGSPIANLADSLISWYAFEGNANDYQDANNGTVYNAQNVYTGELGQGYCYYFDGDGDYIVLPVIPLTGDETGSISVWAKSSVTATPAYNIIVDRYSMTDCIWITSDNTWAALLNETTAYYGTTYDNDWHLFVLTYEGTAGSAQIKYYIDGALYATATETDDWLREANVWRIGGNTNGSSSYWWHGYIDSLGFFKHTLSAAQVLELYNSGDGVYFYDGELYYY